MKSRLLALTIVAASLPMGSALAIDATCPPGWKEATRDDNLVIFTKENEAAGVRELKAYSEFDAPPEKVFKVVTDLLNYPKFMPYVKESTILKQLSPTQLVSYQHLSPPLVDDRDYILAFKLTRGDGSNGGVFKSEWSPTTDPSKPETSDMVRVKINTGSWTLEPLDGGKRTRATYALLTNPGGSIPQWIANRSNTVAIPKLMEAVRDRLAK